jgi:DNA segregation ATPase FtsK/SpoIIIE, S-DNA-T family
VGNPALRRRPAGAAQLTLLESPIRDRTIVILDTREDGVGPEPGGLVEIRMASGPGAGSIYWLPAGWADIGSGPVQACPLGQGCCPSALRVFVDGRGRCQVAPFEGVEVALDREPLAAAAQWEPGQLIAVGRSMLGVAYYRPPDAALHPSADGCGVDFNRPPRLLPPERAARFQFPAPPSAAERRPPRS